MDTRPTVLEAFTGQRPGGFPEMADVNRAHQLGGRPGLLALDERIAALYRTAHAER